MSGLGVASSNYLGVGNDSANSMRRKSDSRLDMHQIAHLQSLAANNSNNASNAMPIGDNSLRTSARNLMQNHYNPIDQQYWNQQQQQAQNYNEIHLRGGLSSDHNQEYTDTELGHRDSALGPFQIMPPQAHLTHRLDCKIDNVSNSVQLIKSLTKNFSISLIFLSFFSFILRRNETWIFSLS